MIEYYHKTKRKLLRGLWLSTAIFTFILIAFAIVATLAIPDFEKIESWTEVVLYSTLASLALSIFIVVLAFFSGYSEYRFKERAFNRQPLTDLSTIGFTKIKILEKTLWVLVEEVFAGKFNNYWVVVDVQSKKHIGFNFMCKNARNIILDRVHIPFREAGISHADMGIVISVPIDSYWTPTIHELQSFIESITGQFAHSNIAAHGSLALYEAEVKKRLMARAMAGG